MKKERKRKKERKKEKIERKKGKKVESSTCFSYRGQRDEKEARKIKIKMKEILFPKLIVIVWKIYQAITVASGT